MVHLGSRNRRHAHDSGITSLVSVLTIVVPYRGDAKTRLPASIRAAAAVAMLADVVAAASEVSPVLVVTEDRKSVV